MHTGSADQWLSWQDLVVMAWLTGMLVFASIQLRSLNTLRSTLRRAGKPPLECTYRLDTICDRLKIDRNITLVSSVDAAVPFVYGIIRPEQASH